MSSTQYGDVRHILVISCRLGERAMGQGQDSDPVNLMILGCLFIDLVLYRSVAPGPYSRLRLPAKGHRTFLMFSCDF